MLTSHFDIVIIGAGIAGASAAYELARAGLHVLVVERESHAGYHTTGRSAALYSETYGNAVMRALTSASKPFYVGPPGDFCPHPLLSARGALLVGFADQESLLRRFHEETSALVHNLIQLNADEVCARVPVLRRELVRGGVFEPDAMDIDVHALHQGYLRGLKGAGGELICNAEVRALDRVCAAWELSTSAGVFRAAVVVNAAGAWADQIGALAGAAPLGLVPRRRTAVTFDPPLGFHCEHWPVVIEASETFYFKPEGGRILASPADETPSAACDAQPDEYDIAVLMDRLERHCTWSVSKLAARWAGLRSFFPDKTVVAGFDPRVAGFFWLAGQGGYGIQTAPAMGRVVANLVRGLDVPADRLKLGVGATDLCAQRLTR